MMEQMARRIAVVTRIIEKAPNEVGRTALMKFLYFLTVLRGVNLGYRFTLYSYGPFDSAVLEDADYANRLNAINVRSVIYPSGYGFLMSPGAAAAKTIGLAKDFVDAHDNDIDWVLDQFGRLNSAELELASTILFIDRDYAERNLRASKDDLVRRVRKIKPHFTPERVLARVDDLQERQLLRALGN